MERHNDHIPQRSTGSSQGEVRDLVSCSMDEEGTTYGNAPISQTMNGYQGEESTTHLPVDQDEINISIKSKY